MKSKFAAGSAMTNLIRLAKLSETRPHHPVYVSVVSERDGFATGSL